MHPVHKVIVNVKHNSVRGLPWGHVVGRLLQLHHLLVLEEGAVVDERHAVQRLAVRAHGRLRYSAPIYRHGLGVMTHIATEECWVRG